MVDAVIGDPLNDVVIPDVAEPFRGFRVWRTKDGSALFSMNGTEWPTDVPLEADCHCRPHRPDVMAWAAGIDAERAQALMVWSCPGCPSPILEPGAVDFHAGHGCGIYATKSFDDAALAYSIADRSYVFGEIEAWGQVYEYTAGFRAQFAAPVRFWRNGNHHVDELANRYGCEVVDTFDADRVRRLRMTESLRRVPRPPVAGGISSPYAAISAAVEALRPAPKTSALQRIVRRLRG